MKSNREIIERWFAIVDANQVDRLGEVESPEIEMKLPFGPLKGTAAHAQLTKAFATAFPNMKHTVNRCIEAGDEIACEGSFTGDHTGPMVMMNGPTVAATNRHVAFDWAGMARIKNGKVTAVNVYFDNMGFMQQLGLIPR